VPDLDSAIDELYQKPLNEFTPARNALAKTLKGADASRVRKLAKPIVVPWAVNQLYWHSRPVYDRLVKAGERLRAAQLAALKGRSADVRGASESHRAALAEAVQKALDVAARAGSKPGPDELTRTLEALSLSTELPEPAGRLTRPLQPAGFEALSGVPVQSIRPSTHARAASHSKVEPGPAKAGRHEQSAAERAREQKARREAERAQRQAELELHRAEAVLDRARAAESQARAAWERAKAGVADAERALSKLKTKN
jgi:hypothetical protein